MTFVLYSRSFDSFVRNRLKVKLLFTENLLFLFILHIQTGVSRVVTNLRFSLDFYSYSRFRGLQIRVRGCTVGLKLFILCVYIYTHLKDY